MNIDATNSLNESGSSPEGVTFTGFVNDLEDVINWAKTQKFYVEPFALAGHSLGARAIVFYASQNPDLVDLIMSASLPWLNHGEKDGLIKDIIESVSKCGYYDKVSKSTGRVLRIKKAWVDDVNKIDLTNYIPRITAQTYVIVGLKDSEKHINCAKQMFELLKCKKQLVLLPNVPHDLANAPESKEIFTEQLKNIFKEMESNGKVEKRF